MFLYFLDTGSQEILTVNALWLVSSLTGVSKGKKERPLRRNCDINQVYEFISISCKL